MRWPAHTLEIRLATKNATKIRRAFKAVLNGNDIAQQWVDAYPTGGSISPQMARDWAHLHINPSKKPMQNALARVYAEGYVVGDQAAKYMVAHLLGLVKAPRVGTGIVDWATWKPGNQAAAALVKPKGSLKRLLDSQRITVANEVFNTKIDRIGTVLARGLDKGWASTEIAKALNTVIADPQQALVIAQTEMSRAVSVATRDNYTEAGIEQVEWLVAEGCEDCQENADASPIGIDETFPSGDTEPPAHPNCMCSLAPYYDLNAPEQSGGDQIGENGEIQIDFGDENAIEEVPTPEEEATPVEETINIDLSLNEPNIKNVTYTDELFDKILENTGVNNLSAREINNLPQDVIAESISKIQGFNALPKVINASKFDELITKENWTPIYRGIGGKTQAEVDGYVNQFKSAPVQFGGRGIYGSGTYVAENRGVAEHFSKANGAKNGELHNFGKVMEMAIHPKAKIMDYEQISKITMGQAEKLRRTVSAIWKAEYTKALKIIGKKEGLSIKKDEYGRTMLDTDKFIVRETNEYGNTSINYDKSDFDSVARIEKQVEALTKEFLAKTDYDKLALLSEEGIYVNVGNRAALEGIDVIRVPKPEYSRDDSGKLSDYYIVLNRGAIAVKE